MANSFTQVILNFQFDHQQQNIFYLVDKNLNYDYSDKDITQTHKGGTFMISMQKMISTDLVVSIYLTAL